MDYDFFTFNLGFMKEVSYTRTASQIIHAATTISDMVLQYLTTVVKYRNCWTERTAARQVIFTAIIEQNEGLGLQDSGARIENRRRLLPYENALFSSKNP
jgi:hypothetical protein